ncbi:GDPmannose 4,6-dehydratase [Abditibacterium utsteinense]|uniref:GDP-mannose 4,6-dehydratase n=1 Tax=Abditibacterium utsteinense TaxID=1960156 RepID=A0A2S8SWM7_9BACT|nr:GDP-mannose 4,6-dehydratase [Abditibacterium utsteinense]PQV65205.1 GDPmannose 4,6-dehydratase [Abditibacterium utsteinense]
MPTAFITGIGGQDGVYLASLLVGKGYQVFGSLRGQSLDFPSSLIQSGLQKAVHLLPLDLTNQAQICDVLQKIQPDEIYHLASQSSIALSFQKPVDTGETNAMTTARLLEATRRAAPRARLLYPSSCDVFGHVQHWPQDESTPLLPRSPYGASKAYSHFLTQTYREAYGLHASCAILYNHESPLRSPHFVTRKVTSAVARIKMGLQDHLTLGNLDVERDWGFAGDYVAAMHLMLQQETPDDYVIATGKKHSLREFVHLAFDAVGLKAEDYVRIDPSLLRPIDEHALVGNPGKANRIGWQARISFPQLISLLVEADLKAVTQSTNLLHQLEHVG